MKIFYLLLLSLASSLSFGQNVEPFYENGKCGLKDKKTGKIIVAPKYKIIQHFQNGLAFAKLEVSLGNEKKGYLNELGQEFIPCQYDDFVSYTERGDFICVKKDKLYGVINMKTGKEIVPCNYASMIYFDGIKPARVELNGKHGFVDTDGQLIGEAQYEDANSFSDDFAAVKLNGKWAFIDRTGEAICDFKYDFVTSFHQGLAALFLGEVASNDKPQVGMWAFMDKSGEEITEFKYNVADLHDYRIPENGDVVVYIGDVNEYGSPAYYYQRNRKNKQGLYGIVNRLGEVVPLKYHNISTSCYPKSECEGLYQIVQKDEEGKILYGFMSPITYEEIIPAIYSEVTVFREGLIGVKLNDKWGFLDKNGKTIIPIQYDAIISHGITRQNESILGFVNGEAIVKFNGTDIYIDSKGNKIKDVKWAELVRTSKCNDCGIYIELWSSGAVKVYKSSDRSLLQSNIISSANFAIDVDLHPSGSMVSMIIQGAGIAIRYPDGSHIGWVTGNSDDYRSGWKYVQWSGDDLILTAENGTKVTAVRNGNTWKVGK